MPNSNINIRSEEVQEILSYVPNWMVRFGNTLILIIIIIMLIICWFVKYPDVISTDIMVTTLEPPEKIYAKVDGELETFLINNNDDVIEKDILAVIDNSADYKNVLLLKSIIDTITVNTHNFSFPFENLPPLILGEISTSFAVFENTYIDYVLNKELKPFDLESVARTLTLNEASERLKVLKSQKDLNFKELSFKKKDLERVLQMYKKGVISVKDKEQKELEYLQAERSYKDIESSLSQTRAFLGDSKNKLKSTSIKKTQENVRLFKRVIQSFYQLKVAIDNWKTKYILQSSIKGKVNFLSYWHGNQSLKKGDLVFTVIPRVNSSFVGKIKAPLLNSGKIKKGQDVRIRLFGFPSEEFGELKGTVKRISVIPDLNNNYLIDVELPNKLVTSYNKKIDFKQEMKGKADIITDDLRLIERFFYQFRKILKH